MCGRQALTLPHDAMSQMFGATLANDLPDVPNYNICPTNQVCAVTSDAGVRHVTSMRWGFIPHWYAKPNGGPLLINARSETIAEKPAFKAAVRQRRCLIPATGFYEWTKDETGNRLPWYIHPAAEEALAFAGVWQRWERDGEAHTTCAIVTTLANDRMAELHSRQPVTIAPADYGLWLGEQGHGAATLMTAAPPEQLEFFRVDPAVNSNRASGPELIEPYDAETKTA
ncbi:SOS response-associated peptidase [uncultured Litoreibacter sp.]|uniref:SOS response-associated peptidase n=1 Tax=uncultured Litoreibacter sp. TaxID=1392394 RepID=UPI002612C08F|nr:SOS response-associated peptidase [uncultured Litoreibacter sp.]